LNLRDGLGALGTRRQLGVLALELGDALVARISVTSPRDVIAVAVMVGSWLALLSTAVTAGAASAAPTTSSRA